MSIFKPLLFDELSAAANTYSEEALRTGAFWLLCAIGFLTNAVGTALLLNLHHGCGRR